MAHSYVMLVLHIVFSTKGRVPFIGAEHRDRLPLQLEATGSLTTTKPPRQRALSACSTSAPHAAETARGKESRRRGRAKTEGRMILQ